MTLALTIVGVLLTILVLVFAIRKLVRWTPRQIVVQQPPVTNPPPVVATPAVAGTQQPAANPQPAVQTAVATTRTFNWNSPILGYVLVALALAIAIWLVSTSPAWEPVTKWWNEGTLNLWSLVIIAIAAVILVVGIRNSGGGGAVLFVWIAGGLILFGALAILALGPVGAQNAFLKFRNGINYLVNGVETTDSGIVLGRWSPYTAPPKGSAPTIIPIGRLYSCYDANAGVKYHLKKIGFGTSQFRYEIVSLTDYPVNVEVLITKSAAEARAINPNC